MKERISYSDVLIKFIEPLLGSKGVTEDELLEKATIGMIAWNHYLSDKFQLPIDKEHKKILLDLTETNQEAKKILNDLVIRKELHFSNYDRFFVTVDTRKRVKNTVSLYVETIAVDKI